MLLSCFPSAASCCAARAKSLWPQNRPIRRADTSRGTTLMTQTPPYMLTKRRSWSTCWRSLGCPRHPTNSMWRSATARHPSDSTPSTDSTLGSFFWAVSIYPPTVTTLAGGQLRSLLWPGDIFVRDYIISQPGATESCIINMLAQLPLYSQRNAIMFTQRM